MFKKILFATTASPTCDNAAKVAFDLELKWDAQLTVFHVLGIPTRGYSPFVTDVRTGEMEQPDPDYVEWVKEEMINTYGDLLKDTEGVEIEAVVGILELELDPARMGVVGDLGQHRDGGGHRGRERSGLGVERAQLVG